MNYKDESRNSESLNLIPCLSSFSETLKTPKSAVSLFLFTAVLSLFTICVLREVVKEDVLGHSRMFSRLHRKDQRVNAFQACRHIPAASAMFCDADEERLQLLKSYRNLW